MHNDTASVTALTVLQGILHIARNPVHKGLVPEPLANDCYAILAASKEGKKRIRQIENPWQYKMIALKEKLLLPGLGLHYVLRKLYIEDYVTRCLNDGVTQCVNLGAGFDGLLPRLCKEFTEVNFVEVDHPATQAVKLESLGIAMNKTGNFNFLPMQFDKQNIEEELARATFFFSEKPTVFIIEGVLMYLSSEQVCQLFTSLKKICKNFKIIFTAAEPFGKHTDSYGWLFRLYLGIMGEPLAWMCDRESLTPYIDKLSYRVNHISSAEALRRRYLPSDFTGPLQAIEYIACCEPS